MKLKVFFSYARENQDLVRSMQRGFRTPLEPWIDTDDLRVGQRFPERLREAVKEECDFFLVLLSNSSLDSEWVSRELAWALEREAELGGSVTFIVPVWITPVPEPSAIPESLRDRQYILCLDHSEPGLDGAIALIRQELFILVAAHYVASRPTGPRALIEGFDHDLQEYKRVAYRLHAVMGDSVRLLGEEHIATTVLTPAIEEYNVVSRKFIDQLPQFARKVRSRWGANLGDDCDAIARFIEEELYRGQVFALNATRNDVSRLEAGPVQDAELAAMDRRKDKVRRQVQQALDEMVARTGTLVAKLRREL